MKGRSEDRKILTPTFCFHLKELCGIVAHLFPPPQLSCFLNLQLISLYWWNTNRSWYFAWNIEDSRGGCQSSLRAMAFSPWRRGRSIGGAQVPLDGREELKARELFHLPERGLLGGHSCPLSLSGGIPGEWEFPYFRMFYFTSHYNSALYREIVAA